MTGATPRFRLRPARAEDLPRLVEIERAGHTHPWSEGQLRQEFGHPFSTVLCAEAGEGTPTPIVGFVVYWVIHDELHVLDVVTAPSVRRLGAGRALLVEALADGARRGAATALLEVRRSNAPAIALYRALGFLHGTVRRGYYPDGEDAVLMSLALAAPAR